MQGKNHMDIATPTIIQLIGTSCDSIEFKIYPLKPVN